MIRVISSRRMTQQYFEIHFFDKKKQGQSQSFFFFSFTEFFQD
jgi:hypothetical protein